MTFEYLQRITVESQLDVDNIGDCVILARNDLGEEFYLLTKTELGWTEVLEYGPFVPDLALLPPNYNIKYNRFEYNEGKLERMIDKFLNDGKRVITQAEVVQFSCISEFLVNPVDRVFLTEERLSDE